MESAGGSSVDVGLVFAAIAVVIVLALLIVQTVRQIRSRHGVSRSARGLAFAAGIVLVVSVALIGLVILDRA